MINLFQPSLGKEELELIGDVFESDWLGKGNYVKNFEKEFAASLQTDERQFVSTTSCTEAIFLASDLLEFNSDDEVIVPTISFPSIGSSVILKNAKLVFCDVDKRSLNVRAVDIESKITPYTKAVFITHYGGFSCDMDPIIELCEKHSVKIIEDSACAVRSFYKGKACGTIGDIGMWSFDAMKTLCTADGGMVYVKDMELRNIAEELLYLGLPLKQKSGLDGSTAGASSWWEFEMTRPGRRAIMNNVTGAMGCAQLKKVDQFISRRKQIFMKYSNELGKLNWLEIPPVLDFENEASYYFFWVQTKYRNELARHLLDNDVYTTFRYWPLHKVDLFSASNLKGDYPNSDYISENTLNLPVHQNLSDNDVQKVIKLISEFQPA